jgi:hypothetical protein
VQLAGQEIVNIKNTLRLKYIQVVPGYQAEALKIDSHPQQEVQLIVVTIRIKTIQVGGLE